MEIEELRQLIINIYVEGNKETLDKALIKLDEIKKERSVNCDCKNPDIGNGSWSKEKDGYVCVDCDKVIN